MSWALSRMVAIEAKEVNKRHAMRAAQAIAAALLDASTDCGGLFEDDDVPDADRVLEACKELADRLQAKSRATGLVLSLRDAVELTREGRATKENE